jgi:hypothetical protein
MNKQEQEDKQQKFFCDLAAALADGKLTPEQACSMIEKMRDLRIFACDILEPENIEQEKQKGFNEIAGVFADYKITTEEACEVFNEWIDEWKKDATPTSTAVSKHAPGIKLTDKERANKGINHTYGLCCSCDAGLDCGTDFIHYNHPSGAYALCMCVACNRHYAETGTDFDFDNF